MSEELQVLSDVSARLVAVDIPYMLTGSLALSYYGRPRMTRDIDIVIELKVDDVSRLNDIFRGDYYLDPESALAALAQGPRLFNLIHQHSVIKIDLIPRANTPYAEVAFRRRRQEDLSGVSIFVITAEDLILAKLDWARDSRSEMQFADVKALIQAQRSSLDVTYIMDWAGHLGLLHLWEEVRQSE